MRIGEQNRFRARLLTPSLCTFLEANIEGLTNDPGRIDREINELFDNPPALREQRDLLTSITDIGETTAARILGEILSIAEFCDVYNVGAFGGLLPRLYNTVKFADQAVWQTQEL